MWMISGSWALSNSITASRASSSVSNSGRLMHQPQSTGHPVSFKPDGHWPSPISVYSGFLAAPLMLALLSSSSVQG